MLSKDVIGTARHQLYTAVISDVLDSLGNMHHAMTPAIRPLDDALVLFGRARTGLYMSVYEADPNLNPYELEIALVDSLLSDDVAVLACPPGGPRRAVGRAAQHRGQRPQRRRLCHRWTRARLAFHSANALPGFAGGIGPLDTKGRGMVMQIDVPVACGGAMVHPNDWIFGDVDGVVVIPGGLVEKVLDLALEKVAAENTVRQELEAGESLATVFARHKIL